MSLTEYLTNCGHYKEDGSALIADSLIAADRARVAADSMVQLT